MTYMLLLNCALKLVEEIILSLFKSSDLRLFLKFSIFFVVFEKARSCMRCTFVSTSENLAHTHTYTCARARIHTHLIVDKKRPAWEACRNVPKTRVLLIVLLWKITSVKKGRTNE